MKRLKDYIHESILDDDVVVTKKVENSAAEQVEDFLFNSQNSLLSLKKSSFTREIKNGKLYVYHKGSDIRPLIRLEIKNGKVCLQDCSEQISAELLKNVYFDNVSLAIDADKAPEFLSNCSNCVISYLSTTDLQSVGKYLKNTKGNIIHLYGKYLSRSSLCSYDNVKGVDLSNCSVVLYRAAAINTVVGLKAKELILQTYNVWDENSKITNVSTDLDNPYLSKCLDHLIDNNDIQCLGIIDNFVQYIDWFVRKGTEYRKVVMKADAKRVPKINSKINY